LLQFNLADEKKPPEDPGGGGFVAAKMKHETVTT
jgi:hypothetical protein